MSVTREAMARAQQEAWTHAKNPGGTARGMFNAGWDAALALVREEVDNLTDDLKNENRIALKWQERAEAAERVLATMTPTEAYDTVYAALTKAEAQLQALQRALHSLAHRDHCWCDTSPGPHAPITHTTRCLSVRAALASPPEYDCARQCPESGHTDECARRHGYRDWAHAVEMGKRATDLGRRRAP